ncbi:phosphotransferase [Winogradskya humida]|uniref:Aminoglycoside phosphotransferase domain-containing protein n=1 Tax=Winogradskya humida TaxID=113566 RepID=A0ABQ3ZSX8_9ACTN|nr:phosphotransferase [Actinoplanes humidus]GIE21669.1 hypothetical protein Ahu01nite_047710 [Actinoplanes humidus]
MTGRLLASGREADVFEIDGTRVLRRYRRDADVTAEAEAMRYVGALDYPVPEVHSASGIDMVLERLDGPTMATSGLPPAECASILADLHRRLHELPPWPDAPAGTSIVHLDLHPENVLMTARGPVVIDWCNVRADDPDLDTAMTALILAEVSLWDHPMSALARATLDEFLAIAPGDPRRLVADVAAQRRGQTVTLTPDELEVVDRAVSLVRG